MTFTSIPNSESGLQTQNALVCNLLSVELPRTGSAMRNVRNVTAPFLGTWLPFRGIKTHVQSFKEGFSMKMTELSYSFRFMGTGQPLSLCLLMIPGC